MGSSGLRPSWRPSRLTSAPSGPGRGGARGVARRGLAGGGLVVVGLEGPLAGGRQLSGAGADRVGLGSRLRGLPVEGVAAEGPPPAAPGGRSLLGAAEARQEERCEGRRRREQRATGLELLHGNLAP